MNIGIVLSGGTGSRFGGDTPKQYLKIGGKEVISYVIDAFKLSETVEELLVVCDLPYQERIVREYSVCVCNSGDSRNKSIKNALDFIAKNFDCDNVLIADAARPMITAQVVDEYFALLDKYDSVITGQKIVDSLGCVDKQICDRSKYYLIQAPEAFKFKIIYDNFNPLSPITATNQQMPENSTLYVNFEFKDNLKITYKNDLELLERRMKNSLEIKNRRD